MRLADELKVLQANVFAMYSQAHGYHWNVEGPLFKQWHAFFLEIYEDVYDQIDTISENIRKLGDKAPFGAETWMRDATVAVNSSENLSAIQMVSELIATNRAIITQLMHIFVVADEQNEQGIANYIAERIDKHQFWNWQLTASVKQS